MIAYECPACLKKHSARDQFAGRRGRCQCGEIIEIPQSTRSIEQRTSTVPQLAAPPLLWQRLDIAERSRAALAETTAPLQQAVAAYRNAENTQWEVSHSHQREIDKLKRLETGRGEILAFVADATIYEYWLELPGYSGPIAGVTAKVTEYGSVEHVSDVKSKTKGGLGAAVAGGVLLGPPGLVAGAVLGRKTETHTEIRTFDNRKYELEVAGPGFAWSTLDKRLDPLRDFRDFVNARSNAPVTPLKPLIEDQYLVTLQSERKLAQAVERFKLASNTLEQTRNNNEQAWKAYLALRLPLHLELFARWSSSKTSLRLITLLVGLAVLLAWTCSVLHVVFGSSSSAGTAVLLFTTAGMLLSLICLGSYVSNVRPSRPNNLDRLSPRVVTNSGGRRPTESISRYFPKKN